ncbi:MAG: alanine--tRNA ligase [Bacteroidales bacterium]|nr:alanine--tRNA ligase [Bacteroidales bacterium]
MTSKEIRQTFLDFFASKGHQIVPSAPMVVKGDPTLMFTNAGMNQFKDWFLGNSPILYPRVADSQKCLRVSGKHNDLEEVGHDSYHHTMFEMLGNWSFGDYFKKEAISWAWELLTEVYKLDKDRIYVTVFEGSESDNVELDEEARGYWKEHISEDRIILGNKKDNFWEMGDTGPCGPCSEIHIDLRSDSERAEIPGAELVNKGHHLVIEIWNLVFIQYNRKSNGTLELLPHKHVDTGMGFERLVMAINGNESNYQGDMFTDIIDSISALSGKKYGVNKDIDVAMRVIADHIRAISFSIADGQLPSNIKAGYVIRRILRRAVRYGYTFLDFNEPFLCRLVPTLVNVMGDAFPELKAQQSLIEKVIKEEEEAFLRTLSRGIGLINGIIEKNSDTKVISGKDTFTLYDTFGFPLDLSELIAKEHGFSIDVEGFEQELNKQKERARAAAAVEEGDWVILQEEATSNFVGYDNLECDVNIIKYRTVKTKGKELYQLVFDQSPFYAESGGQVGDSGYIQSLSDEKINIINTIKENNLNIHLADRIPAKPEDTFRAVVDGEKRQNTANNHTATHLLHFALRQVLGTHIEQKGSYVSPGYLRFDFSHYEKVSKEHLKEVERIVNRLIRADIHKEEYRDIDIDQAKEMGAMALFGEKYGNKVRAIQFGDSIELCGGTHAASTGNLGMIKITSESAVAAGIRRIEAVTGAQVEIVLDQVEEQLSAAKEFFDNTPNLLNSIAKMVRENESYRKAIEEVDKERVASLKKQVESNANIINGIKVFALKGVFRPDIVKEVAFRLHNENTHAVMFAAFQTLDAKPSLLIMYTDDLVKDGANAGKDIKEVARLVNGGGGGQNFLATAGGKNVEGLPAAFDKMMDMVSK